MSIESVRTDPPIDPLILKEEPFMTTRIGVGSLARLFKFRSQEHFWWFAVSMIVLSGNIFAPIFLVNNEFWGIMRFGFCGAYTSTALLAAGITQCGKTNGETFSIDCIWFNALLAIIYGIW